MYAIRSYYDQFRAGTLHLQIGAAHQGGINIQGLAQPMEQGQIQPFQGFLGRFQQGFEL